MKTQRPAGVLLRDFVLVGNAMPWFRANSALCVALFVTLCAFNAPVAHSSDATRKAGPQGKDQPRADGGGQATPPPAEHKGVIPPPPIGDEGIYTDAPNPEAGHEKEVTLRLRRQAKNSLILKGYFEDQRTSLLLLLKWNFWGGWKPRRCSTLPKMLTQEA